MTSPVFLIAPGALAAAAAGHRIEVTGQEGRHGATVRRLRPGEPVDLVDGVGARARGSVDAVPASDRFVVLVESASREAQPAMRLTVVQALLKGDRLDSAVEMLTEIGADEVVPWTAQRCVARWRPERQARAMQRLAAVVQSAGKQSRRARFPMLAAPASTSQVAARVHAAELGVVLHEEAENPLARLQLPVSGEIVLVVGPEGGITPAEITELAAAGGRLVRLGPSVLRASTAGVAAGAIVLAGARRWN